MMNKKTLESLHIWSKKTIEDLRKNGFSVRIFHKREKKLTHIRDVEIKNGIGKHYNYQFSPKGGKTVVVISKNDISYTGVSKCRPNESFSKKFGVGVALERALEIQTAHH